MPIDAGLTDSFGSAAFLDRYGFKRWVTGHDPTFDRRRNLFNNAALVFPRVGGQMAAYLLVDIEVTDPSAYEEYRAQVPALIAAHGGRYLVRGGAVEVLEGTWEPKRTVVLEFPDMVSLKAFWQDPAYLPLRAVRERAATSNLVAVEGI